jgi:hypothetical protein
MPVPEGVHAVKAGRKTYYYWHPNRGTAFAGKPIPLGTDHTDPEFWERLNKARGDDGTLKPGSFDALIAEYKKSKKYLNRRDETRRNYDGYLDKISAAWGDMPVAGLTVAGIYKLRSKYENTPVAANHLVAILRTMLKWGLAHQYGTSNPAREIEPLEIDDEQNAKPWPEEAYLYVLEHAPERLRRAVYLARACGQRRSDIVKYGRRHRKDDGLAVKIGKLRDRDHVIPLMAHQLEEIDSWTCTDTGPWVTAENGGYMTGDNLQSTLNRFVAKHPKLKGLTLKMHGLRANAAIDRKMVGAENKAIGANLCMTTATVEKYITHIDKLALARAVRDQMEAAKVLQFGEKA